VVALAGCDPVAGVGADAQLPAAPPGLADASSALPPAAAEGGVAPAQPPQSSLDASVPGPRDGGVVDAATPPAAAPSPFPPVTDFEKDGPFGSTSVGSSGPNGNYMLYVPQGEPPAGAKWPIVAWMSGGGTTAALYGLLPHLASHGFFVIASNTIPSIGDEVNLGKELVAALDWAIAEAGRAGGPYAQKLDTARVAAMGYSMGSLATFTMAADPRLTTTVHISGGNMVPERIANLRAPAAFICGIPGSASCGLLDSTCDIAAANCDTDFAGATTPVFYANFPSGHLGILSAPSDVRIGGMATAWLRYQLMADASLRAKFVGSNCTYCKDSYWKVKQKNLP
jgi:hypothetical protein